MDFFASDAYLTALARDYYQAGKFEIKTYGIGGRQVRLAEINGGRVLTSGPFYDYVKPITPDAPAQGTIAYLPKLLTSTIALEDEEPMAGVPVTDQEPAPLIVWEGFASWEEYLALVRKRSKNLFPARRRKLRRMTETFGDPIFTFDDPSAEALELCVKWKVQQYQGGHETLEDPRSVVMLRSLLRTGHLVLSTLRFGDRYVAVQAGFLWQGEYMAVIPSYDPDYAQYGVGRELLLRMLEHSYGEGHRSFDLLQGAENYKWDYATHVQLIESAGKPPVVRRVQNAVVPAVKRQLVAVSPQLFFHVKRLLITARRQLLNVTSGGRQKERT